MGIPHVLAVPYPVQGHVIPLMMLVQRFFKQGYKVTFVNTEFNHNRVMKALSDIGNVGDLMHLISIPDGLELWEDRNDIGKSAEAILRVMSGKLEELIEKINVSDDNKITSIIANLNMGWALEVAEKMGIRRAAFWPASAATLALIFSILKLIEDRIIYNDGTTIKNQMFHLSPTMPAMNTEKLAWSCIGDTTTEKTVFTILNNANKFVKLADWIICNSAYELEPAAFTLFPEILPIGPFPASNQHGNQAGYFWPEGSTCLTWLDQQPTCSVIYVAFGSFTVFDQTQFQELALGLELTNKPFLWVVRPDMTEETNEVYPIGFKDRICSRGKMVGWAPQEKVLRHPSVACFLSHCGWNSTTEGISNGVPFLCWPYFGDQFCNQSYICDIWKVGLGFNQDESGTIRQGEIKNKVEQLLGDETYKARALDLKEKVANAVIEHGCYDKNLYNIIEGMK